MLVDFLSNVFNSKAIPGRVALAHKALSTFSGTFKEFLADVTNDGKEPTRIVCPFDTEAATIGIVISATDSTIVAYNWLGEPTLADNVLMVSNLPPALLWD